MTERGNTKSINLALEVQTLAASLLSVAADK